MAFWRSTKGADVDEDDVLDLDELLAPYHVDLHAPLRLDEARVERVPLGRQRNTPLVAEAPNVGTG